MATNSVGGKRLHQRRSAGAAGERWPAECLVHIAANWDDVKAGEETETNNRRWAADFIPIEYDHHRLAAEMRTERLPAEFIETILTG